MLVTAVWTRALIKMAQKILVTGANKGIGLAIVKGLLEKGCFVYLGSRDAGRGAAAMKSLVDAEPKWADMVEVGQRPNARPHMRSHGVSF